MSKIDSSKLALRDFDLEDIPFHLDYWFRSGKDFLASRAVDTSKLGTEEQMKKSLTERMKSSDPKTALTITYDGKPIGSHPINQIKNGDFGVFHAHIWTEEFRRKGIALWTYPRACQIFMDRFELKRILFKTPVVNTGALKVKEKLGIPKIGEEDIGFGIVKAGTRAHVYELTREKLNEILSRKS